MTDVRVVDLKGCARCGGEHPSLAFEKLTHSMIVSCVDGDVEITHWAPCPTNVEPIMALFKLREDVKPIICDR